MPHCSLLHCFGQDVNPKSWSTGPLCQRFPNECEAWSRCPGRVPAWFTFYSMASPTCSLANRGGNRDGAPGRAANPTCRLHAALVKRSRISLDERGYTCKMFYIGIPNPGLYQWKKVMTVNWDNLGESGSWLSRIIKNLIFVLWALVSPSWRLKVFPVLFSEQAKDNLLLGYTHTIAIH